MLDGLGARLPARDAGLYPLVFQRISEPVGIIAPVGQQLVRLWQADSQGNARDLIKDFEDDLDRIDLALIDAAPLTGNQPYAFIGTDAFTGAGQIRFVTTSASTRVEVSIDADTNPEFTILLNGIHSLTAADFLL